VVTDASLSRVPPRIDEAVIIRARTLSKAEKLEKKKEKKDKNFRYACFLK